VKLLEIRPADLLDTQLHETTRTSCQLLEYKRVVRNISNVCQDVKVKETVTHQSQDRL